MGNQNLTEAQRNITDAIARAPTGEDSGLAGMIATNTYSGENSAQAQQKKREKEAFQRVADTALRESIRMQNNALNRIQEEIDKIDGELKAINKEQKLIKGMVDDLESGASIKELEKDPARKKFIDKIKEKSPDIGSVELLSIVNHKLTYNSERKEFLLDRREKLDTAKEKIRELSSDQDNSKIIKQTMDELNLSTEDRLEMSADANNNDVMQDSFIASGEKIEDTKEIVADFGNDASSEFEDKPFSSASFSSEISESFQKEKISPTFKAAAENTEIPEFENAPEFNPELTATPSAAI